MKNIFRKTQPNESLIMAFLQIYREKLSLATFLQVHSNSKEVSYLPWQNKYPGLKATCHIKPKFFLRNKLSKNLLLVKYLISVATALINVHSRGDLECLCLVKAGIPRAGLDITPIIIIIIIIGRIITDSLHVSGCEPINVSNNIIETPNLCIASFDNTAEQTNDPPENRDDNNSFSTKQKDENRHTCF